jgi:hypothetical protein
LLIAAATRFRAYSCFWAPLASALMALLDFSVAWIGGYLAFRSDSELAGKVFKGLMGDLAKDPADVQHVDYPGPWEQADVIAVDFVAVRKDVLMRVDLRGRQAVHAPRTGCRANGARPSR